MTPLYLLVLIPNFIDADSGSVMLQSVQLGAVMMLAFFLVYALYSVTADKLGHYILRSETTRHYLQRGAALTIAGFAVALAFAQQSSL